MSYGTKQQVVFGKEIKARYGQKYRFIVFGDTHFLSPQFSESAWRYFKTECEKMNKTGRTYYICLGDIFDPFSAKERALMEQTNRGLHGQTVGWLNQFYQSELEKTAREFDFTSGKLLGIAQGNHDLEFTSGETGTQRLCNKFKCPYLSAAAFLRVNFNTSGTNIPIDFYIRHKLGMGTGGRLPGGQINKVWHMTEIAHAQIYLMGHNHQRAIFERSRLRVSANFAESQTFELKEEKIILALAGSFVKGYKEKEDSYVVDRGLPPASLGAIYIDITPKRTTVHGHQGKGKDSRKRRSYLHLSWGVI